MSSKQIVEAPLSSVPVDRIRIIRRSWRCFVFGIIGLVPIVGTGLAVQALRLQRKVNDELGQRWNTAYVILYWIAGVVLLWFTDGAFGIVGDLALAVVLFGLQSWHLARSFPSDSGDRWNPGRPELVRGVICAQAGIGGTLWVLALLAYRVVRLNQPA